MGTFNFIDEFEVYDMLGETREESVELVEGQELSLVWYTGDGCSVVYQVPGTRHTFGDNDLDSLGFYTEAKDVKTVIIRESSKEDFSDLGPYWIDQS